MTLKVFGAVMALLWIVAGLTAQPSGQAAEDPDETEMIRQAIASYVKAFNARDAARLASYWSADGVYINPSSGEQTVGREAIETGFENIFSQETVPQLSVATESIQLVSPSVAVERGIATITRADTDVEQTSYSVVYVKQNGNWLIDRVSENEIEIRPSNYERLRELEWLVGDWTMEGDGFRVELSAQWTANRNFISRKFKVLNQSEVETTGLQIIGWDAQDEVIRSWLFDSDGTVVTGQWNRKDDGWSVVARASLIDGSSGSYTTVFRLVDADHYGWQKVNRVLDGEILPNIDELIVTRN